MSEQPLSEGRLIPADTVSFGRALVVLVDDHPNASGADIAAVVTELLIESGFLVDAVLSVASDESEIRSAVNTAVIGGVDLVITIGGTGVGLRDITPEATAPLIDRPVPGIAEALRSSGLAAGSLDAGLSRGIAGLSGSTLVVNLAGSLIAVRDGLATLTRMASYIIAESSSFELD